MDIREVLRHIQRAAPKTVVVTGGEPLLQQIALNRLIRLDKSRGYQHKWHLETNGTFRLNGDWWDWVTVSPKPPDYEIKKSVKLAAYEVKIVVASEGDILAAQLLAEDPLLASTEFCLQPVDNDPKMTGTATRFLTNLREEGRRRWSLSVQVHKFIGVK